MCAEEVEGHVVTGQKTIMEKNEKEEPQFGGRGRVVYLPNNDPPEVRQARYRRGLRALSDAIDYIEALELREREAGEGAAGYSGRGGINK